MRVEITREMFEEAISPLLGRTDMLVEVALQEADLEPSDIDTVLLVGGSTRIPAVQERLEKTFGFAPATSVNVDECVALGAALHAGLTMLRENPDEMAAGISNGLQDVQLTDVCNHSYGTLCAPVDEETGRRVIENRVILKKNTPLPCEASQTFYTVKEGQSQIETTITQGEDTDPRYVNQIATQKFELPPDRPPDCPIKVTYGYDVNQRMHCKFEDIESGRVLEMDVNLDKQGNVTEGQIEVNAKQMESVEVK
jgi:molecular chaperone DnaK